MPTLRGHHLICLHFFSGEGYNTPFTENLKHILKRVESEEIEIVPLADSICNKCPYLKNDKCTYDEKADKNIRMMDEAALKLLDLSIGQRTTWQVVKRRIPYIFHKWHDKYCNECDWKQTCEKNNIYMELKKIKCPGVL